MSCPIGRSIDRSVGPQGGQSIKELCCAVLNRCNTPCYVTLRYATLPYAQLWCGTVLYGSMVVEDDDNAV